MKIAKTTNIKPADYLIRPGEPKDFMSYLKVCQRSAATAYHLPGYENLFSAEHFFNPDIMSYWKDMAANTSDSRWWVAELVSPAVDSPIVGGICLKIDPRSSRGSGFYVDPVYQNQGIGRALWGIRQQSVAGPLYFEVYSHAARTIAYHERHGAKRTGRERSIHWQSWPSGVSLTALEFISS